MTAPHGQIPPAETSPNGRRPAVSRAKAPVSRAKAPVSRAKAPVPRAKAPVPRADVPVPRPDVPVPEHEDLTESAAHHAGGAEGVLWHGHGPFTGFGFRQAAGILRYAGRQAVREPQALLRGASGASRELLRVVLGKSEVAPDKRDKRFADPAWRENPVYRAVMQTYLYLGSGVDGVVDNVGVEGVNAERARFALTLVREALAPTNFLLGNPAALKRVKDTRGGSIRSGIANWAGDVRHNRGMPSMVDRRPFRLGENIAATPGAVIHRTEVFELIQYTPQSGTVYQRPMLVVPPQVNKYYALDLAPGRSMVEYLLKQGIQVFCISWRNPTGAQRDWNLDTYAQATIEAIDAAREVTGSPDVNIMGGCLGGIMAALVQAHLAALQDHRIHSATMTVTLLDCHSDGRMFLFATPQSLALAKKASARSGVIDGWQMAQVFAWLRPNDLVWNYWVNNYLLGKDPPAFDILAWNADTTRLTSAFHHQVLDMVAGNQLVHPGAMKILGTPIDLSRIGCDTYVVAGRTDHITPWETCYRNTQMVSGRSQFVLCSSGHIQTVVADPKHRGLGYYLNPETPPEAEQWMAGAQRHEGSWWEHWAGWLADRSGEQVAAAQSVGSPRFPAKEPAPGTYVQQ